MRDDVDQPATESVWGYPRPPIVVASGERVVIELDGEIVAYTARSLRVLETSHPPVYYLPGDDIAPGLLRPVSGRTWCEFKGSASYFDVVCPSGRVVPGAAWHYPQPTAGYEALVGHVAFYPGRMDRCTVDDETVVAQPGDFYGGWITSKVTGPFKGASGLHVECVVGHGRSPVSCLGRSWTVRMALPADAALKQRGQGPSRPLENLPGERA